MSEQSFADYMAAVHSGQDMPEEIPAAWKQGRTTYGGFSSALLLAAARRGRPDLPPLRSVLINFTGPIGAFPDMQCEELRQGRNVTTLQVRAEQDGKPAAVGIFSFGRAQDSEVAVDLPAPEASPPEETEAYVPEFAKRMAPKFQSNFDIRLIEGGRPFTGSDKGYARVWARHRDPEARGSLEGLLCLADIVPPAVFPLCKTIGPNSSVNWICNFLQEDLNTEDGWWMVETELSAGRDGYSSQVMRAWNSSGQLVLDGMQSVLIFV